MTYFNQVDTRLKDSYSKVSNKRGVEIIGGGGGGGWKNIKD